MPLVLSCLESLKFIIVHKHKFKSSYFLEKKVVIKVAYKVKGSVVGLYVNSYSISENIEPRITKGCDLGLLISQSNQPLLLLAAALSQ